eukprot:g5098.t1
MGFREQSHWISGGRVRAVIDSGATDHLCNTAEFFDSFSDDTVEIRVADRVLRTRARRGKFKKNSLGLVDGLFHPDLGPTLLLSVGSLVESEDDDSSVNFSRAGCDISVRGGTRLRVHREDGLYQTPVEFAAGKAPGGGTDASSSESKLFLGGTSAAFGAKSIAEKLRKHEQCAHFHVPGLDIKFCPACAMQKGRADGHAKERPVNLQPEQGNDQVDADYVGPFPESLAGNKWLLVMVETFWKWPEVFATQTRDECGDKLREYVRRVGKPKRVRTDNGKEFKEPGSSWQTVCPKPKNGKEKKRGQKNAASGMFATEADHDRAAASFLAQLDKEVDKLAAKQSGLASETSLCYTIQLTRKQVVEDPDCAKYIEADTLERTQLEAMKCWRPVRKGELADTDEVIPAVIVYTRRLADVCAGTGFVA